MQTLVYLVGFVVVCLASHQIGRWFSRIHLPYITGYLFAGALVSSFGLDFLPRTAAEDLRFIDALSLGVIAFVAGSELYLKELRRRLHVILWTTGGILVAALVLLGVALYLLTEAIPFTQGMAPPARLAVALLGSTVLLALSPPSTIAVIREVRARGPFTATSLSVTVFMDVAIIVLFAVSTSVASALLTGVPFSAGFAGVLLLDLSLAVALGYGVGQLLRALLASHGPALLKTAVVVTLGWGIFAFAAEVKALSAAHLPFEIYLEPLLIALVGGFYVANFTRFRDEFEELLHRVGPPVYVAFFTLTGISLKLDVLVAVLPVALALFLVRAAGLFAGSWAGGTLAGTPPAQRRLAWMAFVTQAGIALGLAREVAVQFPALGDAFATLIISVVVLNEIFGPLFLKAALRRAGETHEPVAGAPDDARDALILGIEGASRQLARQLQDHGWRVRLADPDPEHVAHAAAEGLDAYPLPALTAEALRPILTERTDAIVAMLDDDQANLQACELARTAFGVSRLVVRAGELARAARFRELGALVVDHASALVHLMDQAVRAPQSASLLLHQDGGRDVVQITVSNPDVDGLLVRDLRLPPDVLLLDILRDGHALVPSGHSSLRLRDEVTLLGRGASLDAVTLRLGY